jgi:hypothetical protein
LSKGVTIRLLFLGLALAAGVLVWATNDLDGPITQRQTGVLICLGLLAAYFIWQEGERRKEERLRRKIEED